MENKVDKKKLKYSVIVIVIILFVITVASLFNLNFLRHDRVYGSNIEERINRMEKEIILLEKENSNLRSRTTALFILVSLSLIFNFGIMAERIYSFHKNRKAKKMDRDAKN